MSTHALAWALTDAAVPDVTPPAGPSTAECAFVLVVLAGSAGEGTTSVDVDRLAGSTRLSPRQVEAALRVLAGAELIAGMDGITDGCRIQLAVPAEATQLRHLTMLERRRSEFQRCPDRRRLRAEIASGHHRCASCGAVTGLVVDHIHPLVHGGDNHRANYQMLCGGCNGRKGTSIHPGGVA